MVKSVNVVIRAPYFGGLKATLADLDKRVMAAIARGAIGSWLLDIAVHDADEDGSVHYEARADILEPVRKSAPELTAEAYRAFRPSSSA